LVQLQCKQLYVITVQGAEHYSVSKHQDFILGCPVGSLHFGKSLTLCLSLHSIKEEMMTHFKIIE